MNFLGMDKVIAKLKARKVRSIDQLWYYIFHFLIARFWEFFIRDGDVQTIFNSCREAASVSHCLTAVIGGLAAIIGFLLFLNLYWINSRRDDQDFILRLVTLDCTIGWRLMLISLPLLGGLLYLNSGLAFASNTLLLVNFSVIHMLVYLSLVTWGFMKVAGKKRKDVSF